MKNRCESTAGGGRYRCKLSKGHEGKHQATGVFNTWEDREPLEEKQAEFDRKQRELWESRPKGNAEELRHWKTRTFPQRFAIGPLHMADVMGTVADPAPERELSVTGRRHTGPNLQNIDAPPGYSAGELYKDIAKARGNE